jgi:hypothetical protein
VLLQQFLAKGLSIKQLWPLVGQGLTLIITWGVFLSYLMSFGRGLHLNWLLRFQYIYGSLGYFCYPLVIPDLWMLYVGCILIPIVLIAVLYYINRTDMAQNWRVQALSFLGIMSLGLFSYDMTRTCESNLLACSFYVPLIGAMITSESRILIGKKILPRESERFFICPKLIFYYYFTVSILLIPESVFRTLAPGPEVPTFQMHTPFLQSWIKPGDPVIMISDLSGLYFLATGGHDLLKLASSDEWMCTEDIDHLVGVLQRRESKRLVVDENFFDYPLYRRDVYQRIRAAIAENYHQIGQTPDHRIHLYEATVFPPKAIR